MEVKLAEPELNLAEVAREHALPVRYVQKLLGGTGQGFSAYVRDRRLDRAKADLASPLHAQMSITDICLRWGFNDIAYFSRSFRERFAMSPREHRKGGRSRRRHQRRRATTRLPHVAPHPRRRRRPRARTPRRRFSSSWKSRRPIPGQRPRPAPTTICRSTAPRCTGAISAAISPPCWEVDSGDVVTIETLTHHGGDDYERMVEGDEGAESVFASGAPTTRRWTAGAPAP